MKSMIGTLLLTSLFTLSAHAQKPDAELIANIFGLGVYAQMDQALLAKNPKAKVEHWVANTRSWGNTEVYKIFRRSETENSQCGAVIYITDGVPTLESGIDCAN